MELHFVVNNRKYNRLLFHLHLVSLRSLVRLDPNSGYAKVGLESRNDDIDEGLVQRHLRLPMVLAFKLETDKKLLTCSPVIASPDNSFCAFNKTLASKLTYWPTVLTDIDVSASKAPAIFSLS
jgi:hypothetical protein